MLLRWGKDDAEPAQVEGSGGEKIKNNTKKKSAVAKKAKQNLQNLAEQEVSKKTACNREEKQAAGTKQKAAKVCVSEDTEAMQRMKRTMSEDCAYVPGSYKEARLKFLAKKTQTWLLPLRGMQVMEPKCCSGFVVGRSFLKRAETAPLYLEYPYSVLCNEILHGCTRNPHFGCCGLVKDFSLLPTKECEHAACKTHCNAPCLNASLC